MKMIALAIGAALILLGCEQQVPSQRDRSPPAALDPEPSPVVGSWSGQLASGVRYLTLFQFQADGSLEILHVGEVYEGRWAYSEPWVTIWVINSGIFPSVSEWQLIDMRMCWNSLCVYKSAGAGSRS